MRIIEVLFAVGKTAKGKRGRLGGRAWFYIPDMRIEPRHVSGLFILSTIAFLVIRMAILGRAMEVPPQPYRVGGSSCVMPEISRRTR
jgi:hypothetical protein